MDNILLNRIITPDGTELISRHRHDYVQHTDKNGQYYAVDGGTSYLKRSYDIKDYTEASVYDTGDTPHETIREYFHWGQNYYEDGRLLPETKWVALKDLTTPHISAILETQNLSTRIREYFEAELKYRT